MRQSLLSCVILAASCLLGCPAPVIHGAASSTTGSTGNGQGTTGSSSTTGSNSSGTTGTLVPECTACVVDEDCGPGGACVLQGNVNGNCATPCDGSSGCSAADSSCTDVLGNGSSYCFPNSGSCPNGSTSGSTGSSSGNGVVCSACTQDSDCASGLICNNFDVPATPYCDTRNNCYQDSSACGGLSCASNFPSDCACPQVAGSNSSTSSNTTGTTGTTSSSGTSGTTGSTSGEVCGTLVGPDVPANCTCASGHTCTADNCYNGYWCDTSDNHCVAPPTSCSSGSVTTSTSSSSSSSSTSSSSSGTTGRSSSTSTSTSSSGGTTGWTGSVTASGGTVNRLYFAAVGDSRPPNVDDTSNYPTAIITQIYQDMTQKNPEFAITTGDYMYASTNKTTGQAQINLYAQARAAYPGVVFPVMGNHECDGYTADNCNSLTQTNNIKAFMSTLVQPIGQTLPYYRFDVNDSAGQWTAKFIVLAMNYWNSTQESWLRTQLAQSTTYTFIVRHEPESATTAPGVTPSDSVISSYPYTAKIVGHTHEFSHSSQREVIVGNGGAPLAGSGDYGYAIFEMNSAGDIQVSSIDYTSNTVVNTFTIPK